MKSLVFGALIALAALPSLAETVKITVERNGTSQIYTIEAGQSGLFNAIKTQQFMPTSGDCSRFDVSKLKREAKDGDSLRVNTSKSLDGVVFVTLEYESYKFLGTRPHQVTERCTVNNPSSNIAEISQTSSLRKGEPSFLLSAIPGVTLSGVLE